MTAARTAPAGLASRAADRHGALPKDPTCCTAQVRWAAGAKCRRYVVRRFNGWAHILDPERPGAAPAPRSLRRGASLALLGRPGRCGPAARPRPGHADRFPVAAGGRPGALGGATDRRAWSPCCSAGSGCLLLRCSSQCSALPVAAGSDPCCAGQDSERRRGREGTMGRCIAELSSGPAGMLPRRASMGSLLIGLHHRDHDKRGIEEHVFAGR